MTGKIWNISPIKTVRMNLRYFGISGLRYPKFVVARNVQLKLMKGMVEILKDRKNDRFFILLGFGESNFHMKEQSIWYNEGKICFGGNANLGQGFVVENRGQGILRIGNGFLLTAASKILCHEEIIIGDDCLCSWGVTIMDTDFHKIYSEGRQINRNRPVVIKKHVWIGMESKILKGAVIEEDSVIGAGSIITRSHLVTGSVIVGNGVTVKNHITWEI